jgi:hypothetical protein
MRVSHYFPICESCLGISKVCEKVVIPTKNIVAKEECLSVFKTECKEVKTILFL